MIFNSLNFLVFLAVLLVVFYLGPQKHQWKVLLLFSVLFYVQSGLEKLPFILGTSWIAFWTAQKMDNIYKQQDERINRLGPSVSKIEIANMKEAAKKRCKRYLIISIVVIIGMLCYTKYIKATFALFRIFSYKDDGRILNIIVPLGISYYTFSTVGYLLDVYWKKEKAEKNYFRFALFVFYFPQILQGPISRHKIMVGQFLQKTSFEYVRICHGFQLMLWGYFKKLVIADRLAIYVTQVFDGLENAYGFTLFIALLFGTIQLYTDFSGCMDIASGVSELFGIKLEKNFSHPFFSTSITEFWRRWHITLGTWFRDYVYLPLATSPTMLRVNKWTKKHWGIKQSKNMAAIIPTYTVWLLTGIWHGNSVNYVIWGIYFGSLISMALIWKKPCEQIILKMRINAEAKSWKLIQMTRTFLLFMFGRAITLPGTLHRMTITITNLLSEWNPWVFFDGSLYGYGLDSKDFGLSFILIVILFFIDFLQEKICIRDKIDEQNLFIRWGLYYGVIFGILILGIYGPGYEASSFMYMNY